MFNVHRDKSSIVCEIFDCELFIAWSIYFSKQKNILLFLGLFVLIFYSGGEGVFSLFKQSVGFLFYLFIDFFLPFALKEALTKLIMKMSGDHVVLFA